MADALIERLRGVSLFSRCSDDELGKIADIAQEEQFPDGHILARQGRDADHAFVLEDGGAEITRDGRYITRIGPGALVGELSMITGQPPGATVRLTADSLVLSLPADRFSALLDESPELTKAVMLELAERLMKSGQTSVSGR